MKERTPSNKPPTQSKQPAQGRTNVPGQNTQQNDSPDHDLYHDENRRNQFDPETAKAVNPTKEQKR